MFWIEKTPEADTMKQARNWHVGQRVDYIPPPSRFGEECEPTWWVIRHGPVNVMAAKGHLITIGARSAWFPTETRWKAGRGSHKRVSYEAPLWPGYIFALFEREPIWRQIIDQSRGNVIGAVGWGGVPRPITAAEMMAMRQVPDILDEQRQAERLAEEARRFALMPRAGERASVVAGPLAGCVVDVLSVSRGVAAFLLGGAKAYADAGSLQRCDQS